MGMISMSATIRPIKFRVFDAATGGYSKNTMKLDGGGIYGPHGHGERYIFEQFTGMQDRTGKEIYEGDIVEVGAFPRLVFWDDGSWSVKAGICFHGDAAKHCKVLGNVHENRSLLDGVLHGVAGSHYMCNLRCSDLRSPPAPEVVPDKPERWG
jgi:hypothetical protein